MSIGDLVTTVEIENEGYKITLSEIEVVKRHNKVKNKLEK